jgi:hypothetical protein
MQSLLSIAPPSDLDKNLQWFRKNSVEQQNTNIQQHDTYYIPFQVMDKSIHSGERPFLLCRYNEVGEGRYRSPWTNRVYRSSSEEQQNVEDEIVDVKNEEVRRLEVTLNDVWDAYKNLYYGNEAVGSVYLIDTSPDRFALEGCFGIKKICADIGSSWNCINKVRSKEINEHECEYTVDTTICVIILPVVESNDNKGDDSILASSNVEIGTTMTTTCTKICKIQPDKVPVHNSHVENIGTIIEANEIELRSNLERVILPKHQEIITTIQKKLTRRPQVNPLMGMMMNSDMVKKRIAKAESES